MRADTQVVSGWLKRSARCVCRALLLRALAADVAPRVVAHDPPLATLGLAVPLCLVVSAAAAAAAVLQFAVDFVAFIVDVCGLPPFAAVVAVEIVSVVVDLCPVSTSNGS